MFATSICKHTRTKEGAPSSREASANYVGPCGQKFQVTYLRSCARFHGLGAVRSPETKQAKTKGGGQMGKTESEMDKETGATSSCDNDLEAAAAAENEWRKEYPRRHMTIGTIDIQICLKSRSKSCPCPRFSQITALMRAHILDTSQCSREN